MIRSIRRASVVLAATATIAASTVSGAMAETPDEVAPAAAAWLTTQLEDGTHVYYDAFDWADTGLTADVVYALAATGVGADTIDAATDWLATQAASYTGPGATAKLVLAAEITGRDANDFGGVALVDRLEGYEDAETGLYTDNSWDSTLNQALAVLALARAGADPSDDAVGFLLDQQCDGAGFRAQIEGETCTGNVDTTAFAVQALLAVGTPEAVDAAAGAVDWLADLQAGDGSFVGDGVPSSNSTGLAALALEIGGRAAEAANARAWVAGLQAGCDSDTPGAILADLDGEGETLRATPQAILGLVGVSLADVSADGASVAVPLLDCPAPDEPGVDQPSDEDVQREVTVACDADGEVAPGDDVACDIAGLDADETVHVLVTLNPTLLDEDVTADPDGLASFAFTVPTDASEGDVITILIDGDGDTVLANLSIVVAGDAQPITVVDTPEDEPLEGTEAAPGELPRTGAPIPALLLGALLLLLLGGALLTPRRRNTTA